MKLLRCDDDFSVWRGQARQLLLCAVPPHAVSWEDVDRLQLFAAEPLATYSVTGREIRIPALLLEQLEAAARYRMSGRWNLLYRILWRVVQGERHAALAGDADGSELHRRLKSVSREAHHMHAFCAFIRAWMMPSSTTSPGMSQPMMCLPMPASTLPTAWGGKNG